MIIRKGFRCSGVPPPIPAFLSAVCRAVALRLVGLCVLLFTLWSQVTCGGKPYEDDCRLCQYNYKLYQVNLLLESLKTSWPPAETGRDVVFDSVGVKNRFIVFLPESVLGNARGAGDVQADRV